MQMIQTGDGACLALETVAQVRFGEEVLGQDSDGYFSTQTRFAVTVDLAYATGSDGPKDFMGSQTSPSTARHKDVNQ